MTKLSLRDVALHDIPMATPVGYLTSVTGVVLEASGCRFNIGQRCRIERSDGAWLDAQVVGFRERVVFLMPFASSHGLRVGARVMPCLAGGELHIGRAWLGRIVDGLGAPLDGRGALSGTHRLNVEMPYPNPLAKTPVREAIDVGVRAINGLLTLGKGQRVGLFAGSGVGKSVLLGMITRHTAADVVVVGLIGERGREVGEFVTQTLGPEGLAKAVVVVAPADASPAMRMCATELCHAIAAHFRDDGSDVLLLVDSLTRYAMACREVALALGEPPATRGYPPSVFGRLPRMVESAGNGAGPGSMSAIYTVLAEGDDQQDPVADTARAILDGHIVLTRALAERGHYPAIDIGASISRCMSQVATPAHVKAARHFKELCARHAQVHDLIPLGGYVAGADPMTDRAVALYSRLEGFLRQDANEGAPLGEVPAELERVLA